MARKLKKVTKDNWAAVEKNFATLDGYVQELNKRLAKYNWPTVGRVAVTRLKRGSKGDTEKGAPPVPPTFP